MTSDDDRLGRLLAAGSAGTLPDAPTTSSPPTSPEQRVVGREAGVVGGDDEELAARRAGLSSSVLAIATTPRSYFRSLGGRLDDLVARAALAGARRVAALDDEARDDAVEREAVEEVLAGERDERAAVFGALA